MKKLVKGLSIICLLLVLVLPLALVGCTKNYTITVELKNDGGDVFLANVDGKSVVGRNTVEAGTKFEYRVSPYNGYVIESVVVDGEDTEITNKKYMYLYLEDVSSNHTIEVTFALGYWTVYFEYLDNNVYKTYTTMTVQHNKSLDITDMSEGIHWYVEQSTGRYYLENGEKQPNIEPTLQGFIPYVITISSDLHVRTDLSLAELKALLGEE